MDAIHGFAEADETKAADLAFVILPARTFRELSKIAARLNCTVAELMSRALSEYIDRAKERI